MESCLLALQARLTSRNTLWSRLRQGLTDWDPIWVPDQAASGCAVCAQAFSLRRRRHHCRMCGAVVCAACSPHRPRGKRVCAECVEEGGGAALDLNGSTAPKPNGSNAAQPNGSNAPTGRLHGPASGWLGPPRDDGPASGRTQDRQARLGIDRGGRAGQIVQVPDFTAESRAAQRVVYSPH